jgi:hypothetical protein
MKMGNIERAGRILRQDLSEESYFQSLLEQASYLEMLQPNNLEKIQLGCLAILAKQSALYTKGASSSVRTETAKNILASIMFTIGISLKTYPVPDDAVDALKSEKMETLYDQGLKRINVMIRTAKTLHSLILRDVFETPNVFYAPTVVDAITGFFKLYDPAFGAHEIHITADYPVYNPMKKKNGIEFILDYLECVSHENAFCLYFPASAVHRLLSGYDSGYAETVLNIYEPVLTTVIGCVLSGANARLLNLGKPDLKYLEKLFDGKPGLKVRSMVSKALKDSKKVFAFPRGLERYMEQSLPLIASSIEIAAESHTLKRIFIIPKAD